MVCTISVTVVPSLVSYTDSLDEESIAGLAAAAVFCSLVLLS